MTTTLQLNDALLADAEKLALPTDRTLEQLVEDSLRQVLARSKQNGDRLQIKLHTFGGGQLQPGINLSNNAALADLLDDFDGLAGR